MSESRLSNLSHCGDIVFSEILLNIPRVSYVEDKSLAMSAVFSFRYHSCHQRTHFLSFEACSHVAKTH